MIPNGFQIGDALCTPICGSLRLQLQVCRFSYRGRLPGCLVVNLVRFLAREEFKLQLFYFNCHIYIHLLSLNTVQLAPEIQAQFDLRFSELLKSCCKHAVLVALFALRTFRLFAANFVASKRACKGASKEITSITSVQATFVVSAVSEPKPLGLQ